MSIPQAVLRQGELSDRLLAQQLNPTPPADPAAPPAPENSGPPETPPVVPSAETPPETPTAPPETTPTAPPHGDSAAPTDGEPRRVDWKQKYLVLEGKYRAEVPRYAAQVRELAAKVSERDSKIIALHEEIATLRKAPPSQTADDDVFDPKFIERVRAEARTAAENAVNTRVVPLEERAAATEHTTAIASRATFEQDVADHLNDSHNVDWRTIDTLPAFHAYLANRDPVSGVQRQLLLNDAVAHVDATRAAAIFQDYLNRTRPVEPARPAAPAADPRAHLATPARGSAGAPVTEAPKPTYTAAEITAHYTAMAKALTNGSPASVLKAMELKDQDIQLAQREGRVR